MPMFHVYSDLPAVDANFVSAIAEVLGETDVAVVDTWLGDLKQGSVAVEAPSRTPRVAIEWEMARGQFALCICMAGWGVPTHRTEAELSRLLAMRLGRPLLQSDCSPSGRTWFKFEPDGAVYYVISGSEVDDMDLIETPRLIWKSDEALPAAAAHKDVETARSLRCRPADADNLCSIFQTPYCPVSRRL